jgi:superoxide dismutase, Cu-Zn family
MKKFLLIATIVLVLVLACKSTTAPKNELNLIFSSKSNSSVTGTATFIEKNGTVTFLAKISGLQPGIHAIHIHEKSDCSAPDGSSAGGHWNPTFKKHGKWGDSEYHKGDIGNFTADENGNGTITLTTNEWCIDCGDETKKIIGKGLIVHQGADDFVTQPTGNAGARLACSAIINKP